MYNDSDDVVDRSSTSPMYDGLTLVEDDNHTNLSSSTSEQRRLATWNATRQEYPGDLCVPQLVARQARATPSALALSMDEEVLNYQSLNQRSNQLANYLQTLGVRPNVLVGLCIERSCDMVVGLLAILKAGGAYVPLDPSYPPERLDFMLKDAGASVLLTRQSLLPHLNAQEARVICLDAAAPLLAQQSSEDPAQSATGSDLAYVIYTSGSTGRPKGVMISHHSLLNLVFWHQQAFKLTPADRATQVTSPAFDATGWELWPYLTIGASIYLPDDETRVAPLPLRDWLLRNAITITFLSTALAEGMLPLEWPATTPLRLLLTGADTLHRFPSPDLPFALINNYGPTEATVVATSGRVLPASRANELPPIGRPIANTRISILDDHLRRVPIGEPGELYIGGAGLARGYLNRPDLTAERFIRDPFSDDASARLYRTGDLARFLPDGQIAFMGRTDQQMKLRGFRIEPYEIVSVLNRHPAIQSSLVVVREDIPGDQRLVAYLLATVGADELNPNALREMLTSSLPDYMIPATFVLLESLPLTHNGKIDRDALPVPAATNTLRAPVIAAPGTPTEARLAEILATLLKMEQVGIDDNFFMLGGHSLLGTQVIARIAESFGVDLSLHTLFSIPTVRQLSAEIERLILLKLETMSDEEALSMLSD